MRMKQEEGVTLIVDAMCGKLARWLRFLGIDALYVPDADPAKVESLARRTGRTIVTRSHRFANRKGIKPIVLSTESLDSQIAELGKRLPLKQTITPLHRCSLCNEPLREIERGTVEDRVPPFVYQTQERFLECPNCKKVYWQGTHYRNIRKRLETLLALFLLVALLLPACTKKVLYHTTDRGVPIARILIAEEQPSITISSYAPITIKSGSKRFRLEAQDTIAITTQSRYSFPMEFTTANSIPIAINGTEYPGTITIRNDVELSVVNEVDLETYLKGVVPHEIGTRPLSEIEVVKAQAVAARTYAIKHLDLQNQPRYDLVATVFDQVYKGMLYRNPVADSAVDATYGQIITYRGTPIEAKYSSTCGGITSDVRDNWGDEVVPYLRSIRDSPNDHKEPFCSISPLFRWKERYGKEPFYQMLSTNLFGEADDTVQTNRMITGFRLGRNAKSKRVTLLEVTTVSDTFSFKGLDIRRMLKPGEKLLWSNYFTIDFTADSIIIDGRGAGHGCGMCQWGAIGMAQRGYTFDAILKHYYPGTRIEKVY
jgi:SpoIID/LytB domain protein